MILIKNATVYAPEPLGKKDVLLAGGKIVAIDENIQLDTVEHDVIDREGYTLVPGFIDNHVHVTGGGGEAGYASRVPEIIVSDFVAAGITSVVGLLGTDGHTRTMRDLIAKTKALRADGISAYALSGSYQVPVRTFTESIEDDMVFIEEIIGAGEIAISDHRSSSPTLEELKKIFSSVHVGGLLSGKGGVLNVHVGSGKTGLTPLRALLDETDVSARKLIPTHINRNTEVLKAGVALSLSHGVPLDFTAYSHKDDELSAYNALKQALDAGVDEHLLMMSSDGQGSLPVFDEEGRFLTMGIGRVHALYDNLRKAVQKAGISMETALRTVTENVATLYNLKGKGRIDIGFDADLLIFDENLGIHDLILTGDIAVKARKTLHKGTFE